MPLDVPNAYEPDGLLTMAGFSAGLDLAAQELLETFHRMPRRVRYVADLQRWLISHAALALHFEHKTDPSKPPVTPVNLQHFLGDTQIASKNTISAFLMEMRHYQFGDMVEAADHRYRPIEASEATESLARHYFAIHLRALDIIDGGSRQDRAAALPGFITHAQPVFARAMLHSEEWRNPPPSLFNFVKSDTGSNILHVLVSRAPQALPSTDDPIWIGEISPNRIAEHCLISPAHVSRLISRARHDGMLGWARSSHRGEGWISPQLVRDYRRRQAIKLAAVSQAARHALQVLR